MLLLLFSRSFWHLVVRLGPAGFIALGLADNSIIPLPGSMDALAIVLAASNHEMWWYYGLLATLGSVIGGYVTFRLARHEGRTALDKRLGEQRAAAIHRFFNKMGFWSVFIGGVSPPPVPTVAIIATAGALEYSTHRFLIALTWSRLVRFMAVTWLAAHYGRGIFRFFSKYYKPALWSLIGLAIAGTVAALVYFLWHRKRKKQREYDAAVSKRSAA